MQSYTENPGEVNAAVKKLDKQIEAQKLVAKQAKEQSGYDIIQNPDGTFTTGEAPNRGDPLMEGLKKFQKGIAKKFDGLSKFFSGPSLKMLGSFIASGAIIFGKVLLFIAVLGALVYMLHRGGVIDGIRNFFQSETFERVKEQFGRAFETIKVIGMAAYDVLKNVFEIFKILFTGEGDLLDAVGRLLTSLVKFVLIAIGGIFKGILSHGCCAFPYGRGFACKYFRPSR